MVTVILVRLLIQKRKCVHWKPQHGQKGAFEFFSIILVEFDVFNKIKFIKNHRHIVNPYFKLEISTQLLSSYFNIEGRRFKSFNNERDGSILGKKKIIRNIKCSLLDFFHTWLLWPRLWYIDKAAAWHVNVLHCLRYIWTKNQLSHCRYFSRIILWVKLKFQTEDW